MPFTLGEKMASKPFLLTHFFFFLNDKKTVWNSENEIVFSCNSCSSDLYFKKKVFTVYSHPHVFQNLYDIILQDTDIYRRMSKLKVNAGFKNQGFWRISTLNIVHFHCMKEQLRHSG